MDIRPILSAISRNLTGPLLIVLQVALTLAIVSNAVFVIQQRLSVAARPSGVDDESRIGVLRFWSTDTPEQMKDIFARDFQTLRGEAGVESFTMTSQVPMGQSGWNGSFLNSQDDKARSVNVAMYSGDEKLIATLGLTLVDGRNFEQSEVQYVDTSKGDPDPPVVIVTEALARELFPEQRSAVGQMVYPGRDSAAGYRIIGVVRSLETPWGRTNGEDQFSLVMPRYLLVPHNYYVIRTAPGKAQSVLRQVADDLARNNERRLEIQDLTLPQVRERRYRSENGVAGLLIAVSAFLLLVTASGIVGMASLWVNQRRRQIGVRRALGATQTDIVRYFITENLLITSAGVIIGLLSALALNRFLMQRMSLTSLPPSQVVMVGGALFMLGVLAVLGPALRAARLPPALATRA